MNQAWEWAPRLRASAMLLILAGPWAAVATAQVGPVGAIRGTVVDSDFEVPLAGARISLLQMALGTLSDETGTYLLENLPPGTYTLVVHKEGYERQIIPDVAVGAGRLTEIQVTLVSEVVDLEELVVTGMDLLGDSETGLLELRAMSLAVQDAVSAEVMSRAGASDVAGALKMVVGASVADGKYATVRGLSDRYTGTTLNGVRVPSADPRRRAVQVDLFPTGTLESVTVTKTFTPDLQGDFTGGGIDIKTKSIPDGPVLSWSYGTEYDSVATGNSRFLTYDGGGVDGLGFDTHSRGLPAAALDPLPPAPTLKLNPTPQQMADAEAYDRLVRAFDPAMGVSRTSPEMNQSLSLVGGSRFDLSGGRTAGVIGALTYNHKFDFYENGTNNSGVVNQDGGVVALTRARIDARGTEELLLGGMAALVLQPSDEDEVSLKLIYNHAAEDEARLQVQPIGEVEQELNQALHYTERDVLSAQLHGRHGPVGGERPLVRWFGARNFTRQIEPDVRFFRYRYETSTMSGGTPSNSTATENTRRIFRRIGEDDWQGGFDAAIPFTRLVDARGTIKGGIYFERSERVYGQRSYSYRFPLQGGPSSNPAVAENKAKAGFQATEPGQLWTDVFTDPSHIGLASNRCAIGAPFVNCSLPNQLLWIIEPTGDDVNYAGRQLVRASYAMVELPVTHNLEAIFGARLERTRLEVDPVNLATGNVEVIEVQESGDRAIISTPQENTAAEIDEIAVLPSIGLSWEMASQMHLRASFSRTIARPTFRELAPVVTEEFIFGDEYIGNPDLKLSHIVNWDLRWEWFFRPGDVLAASVFLKELSDPIELISFAVSNRSFVQPVNFDTGQVSGAELEARVGLGPLAGWLQGVAVGANLASIDSEVDVPLAEQASLADFGLDSQERRLQGQPDLLANLNLTYDNEKLGISTGLFYNHVGEMLATGAARGVEDGIPDVFEQPFDSLDLTYAQEVAPARKYLSLGFKLRNLLQSDKKALFRTPGGEEAIKSLRDTSLRYSLTATVKW